MRARASEQALTSFPFLFGGTFIEGTIGSHKGGTGKSFPFLFGGTFIEGNVGKRDSQAVTDFPSFSEGLSLRV